MNDSRPDIVEVVEQYGIELRRRGRQLIGLCPFHEDKNPSFAVTEEKQLYYCYACAEGGDVVEFVKKIESVDFRTALRRLGAQDCRPSPQVVHQRNETKKIASWARALSNRLSTALREIGDEMRVCFLARKEPYVAKELIAEHETSLVRQWAILCDLDDDLNNPSTLVELYAQRDQIEKFVENIA